MALHGLVWNSIVNSIEIAVTLFKPISAEGEKVKILILAITLIY